MQLPSFDELQQLAKENPSQLEELRQRLAQQLIEQAPVTSRARLRGLQFQIDAQRHCAPQPLDACIKISDMMLDSLSRLNQVLEGTYPDTAKKAAVIDIKKHNKEI